MERKVDVVEDLDGKKTVFIHDILFKGKRTINWGEVERYLKRYVGEIYTVAASNDVVYIGPDLPDEYAHSNYTHILRGTNAKAKANAVQGLPELMEVANGKSYTENYKTKALKSIGFYRLRLSAECYDKHFAIFILIKNSHLFTYNRTASLCEKRDISKYRLYSSTKVFTLFYSLCFFLSVVL